MHARQSVKVVTGNDETFSTVLTALAGFLEAFHHGVDAAAHEVDVSNQVEEFANGCQGSVTARFVVGGAQDHAFDFQCFLEVLDALF